MKRRFFMMAVLSLMFVTSGFAQFERSIFNHVGLNVGAGTEGINVGVAAPLTNCLELEAGVSLMPSIKANADVDLRSNVSLVLPSTSRHISILLEEIASSSLPVVSHSAILKSPS